MLALRWPPPPGARPSHLPWSLQPGHGETPTPAPHPDQTQGRTGLVSASVGGDLPPGHPEDPTTRCAPGRGRGGACSGSFLASVQPDAGCPPLTELSRQYRSRLDIICCSVIQPAFKQHFQAPTMCYLWGHRVELDHCPLALETLLTHPFSNTRGALLCALAGIWGLVLGRKRAWLVGAGVNWPHRSRFCVREEHEPGEDTVGAFDAHQSILFGGLQEDGLILL